MHSAYNLNSHIVVYLSMSSLQLHLFKFVLYLVFSMYADFGYVGLIMNHGHATLILLGTNSFQLIRIIMTLF